MEELRQAAKCATFNQPLAPLSYQRENKGLQIYLEKQTASNLDIRFSI